MRIYVVRLIWNAHATVSNKYAIFLKSEYVWRDRYKRNEKTRKQEQKQKIYGVKLLGAYLPACLHDEINSFRLFKEAKFWHTSPSEVG